MGLTVIIPSKTASNVLPCLRAIRAMQPHDVNLLVVDDGLSDREQIAVHYEQAAIIPGDKPFIFARNVNLGIKYAMPEMGSTFANYEYAVLESKKAARFNDGVVLMNDDALLRTPGGFSLLAQAAADHPEYGIIAATCNNVGNQSQWPRGIGLRDEPRMVCFVAVYIPRRTIEQVGLLDEQFIHYGCEDDDYCLRVRNAGLKIGIHDGCYVDHGSLKSSFRDGPTAGGNYLPNLEIFKRKWGMDNWGNPA